MKYSSLPVLALNTFPGQHAAHQYYIERLELHVAKFPIVSEPHAHDFYLLLYITQGQGSHTIDLITYDLRAGSLFFLVPGQAHSWVLSADTEGYILFFTADFYLQQYPAARLAEYPFFNPAHQPVLYLPPSEVMLLPLLQRIYLERAVSAPNHSSVIGAYLFLCLELATRHYAYTPQEQASHALLQIREFGLLLNQHFRAEKTVRYYAERLHLTANHLNAVCRRILNKTASRLIQERVIAEATRLLAHSAQSVAQVAYAVGFEDASYFARYFRKHTGQTPESFRHNSVR
ncbi:helix-turn-helix domain-containing protein [Microvirga sp. STR05]|uniref:Helix-turn-helix domain-containing protein n=1 Tax=Hymenobacter duratus TaxID=2771356 RepID=A0ABR8JIY2_9BACT|nr:helix-turn-helix transcriptional regulator [Hymenobacter duratus]MBD2715330.1 helix-turn-helix domain-containing protein [Hymenobacter duratus]MBR7950237.1 helix-turn-helix domain-containing protein [Microvirga sp. STR05]